MNKLVETMLIKLPNGDYVKPSLIKRIHIVEAKDVGVQRVVISCSDEGHRYIERRTLEEAEEVREEVAKLVEDALLKKKLRLGTLKRVDCELSNLLDPETTDLLPDLRESLEDLLRQVKLAIGDEHWKVR